MRVFVSIALLLLSAVMASAQRTTRRPLRAKPAAVAVDTAGRCMVDTVAFPGDRVVVSGYEKPLRSIRETLHVTNADTARVLVSVMLEIAYIDVDGNRMHSRAVDLNCDIYPGATKMLAFRSWDVQNRFFFAEGPRPRTTAYPYTIGLKVLSARYRRQ